MASKTKDTWNTYGVNTDDDVSRSSVQLRLYSDGPVVWTKERSLVQEELVAELKDGDNIPVWSFRRPSRGWYLHIVNANEEFPFAKFRPSKKVIAGDSLIFDIRTRIVNEPNPEAQDLDISCTSPTVTSAASFSRLHTTSGSTHSRRTSGLYTANGNSNSNSNFNVDSSPQINSKIARSQKQQSQQEQPQQQHTPNHHHQQPLKYIPPSEDESLVTSKFTIEPEYSNESGILSFSWLRQPSPSFVLREVESGAVLARYQEKTSWFSITSSGILSINATALNKIYNGHESFWITVMLAYLEYIEDKEAYAAASDG